MSINWKTLVDNLSTNACVPFLGAGASLPILPSGEDLAAELMARSNVLGPYPFQPASDLKRVAQYVAALNDDVPATKRIVEAIIRERASADASCLPRIHRTLARLRLPVYMTTNYDLLLEQALRAEGCEPIVEVCRWSPDLLESKPSRFDESNFQPTPQRPVVFHLHGAIGAGSDSLVVTEDDYLDFLLNVSRELSSAPATSSERIALPLPLRRAIRNQPLLFVGYSLTDINFLFILRALASKLEPHRRVQRVAVQLSPKALPAGDDLGSYQARVEKYFAWTYEGVSVLWTDADGLAARLEAQLPVRPTGDAPRDAFAP
ncbi:MAG TPA: SIR2 family protein [Polyangiaceae bacterium]|nr:SIR2 family protein [Polyangiaceae bacterium]